MTRIRVQGRGISVLLLVLVVFVLLSPLVAMATEGETDTVGGAPVVDPVVNPVIETVYVPIKSLTLYLWFLLRR